MRLRWPRWIDENNRFCPLKRLIVWLKRATGLGYSKYPPLPDSPPVDPQTGERLKKKSDEVVQEVERLEKELGKLGIRTNSLWGGRHGHD
jgi:hypothetical protein